MAIIKITLLRSSLENVNGVGMPQSIFLDVNIPSIIYYSTDGTIPTNTSNVYVSGIPVPQDAINFTIRAFATNGIDASQITEFILSSTAPMDFFAEGGTNQNAVSEALSHYPFGNVNASTNVKYSNEWKPALFDQSNPTAFYQGGDYQGNPNNASTQLYTEDNYEIEYNLLDSTQMFFEQDGMSRMPDLLDFSNQNVVFQISEPTPGIAKDKYPAQSRDFKPEYNPNAHVTFQDCSMMTDTTVITYNTPCSTSVDVFEARIMSKIYGQGNENQLPTMNFVNYSFNPTTNTCIFSYTDTLHCKWIFSSVPMSDVDIPEKLFDMSPLPPLKGGMGRRYLYPGYPEILPNYCSKK